MKLDGHAMIRVACVFARRGAFDVSYSACLHTSCLLKTRCDLPSLDQSRKLEDMKWKANIPESGIGTLRIQ